MTPSRDFIVHMVATPAVSAEGGDVDSAYKRWLSVDAVDEQYVVNHARQVNTSHLEVSFLMQDEASLTIYSRMYIDVRADLGNLAFWPKEWQMLD